MDWADLGKKKYIEVKSAKVGRPRQERPDQDHNLFDSSTEADKWTLSEKLKLLEGLKRYNEQSEHLSEWVETKTPKEVESLIAELKEQTLIRRSDFNEKDLEVDAPIDKWLKLVKEMTNQEPTDFSEYIAMVFGLIARNEEFGPSGHTFLEWKKIYLYLAALLDDRVRLPELKPMEAAVILDLMDNVGASLHQLDTAQQKMILNFKYEILNKGYEANLESKAKAYYRNGQALRSDIWDDIEKPSNSEAQPGPSTSSQGSCRKSRGTHQPPTTGSINTNQSAPLSHTSTGSNPSTSISASSSPSTSKDNFDIRSAYIKSTSKNKQSSSTIANSKEDSLVSAEKQKVSTDSLNSEQRDSSVSLKKQSSDSSNCTQSGSRNSKRTFGENSDSDETDSETEQAFGSEMSEATLRLKHKIKSLKKEIAEKETTLNNYNKSNVFKRPKFFTLNPLCIPSSLMAIKKKYLHDG